MYENLSIVYDKLMDVDYDTYANIIAQELGDKKDLLILDLGCGSGTMIPYLKNMVRYLRLIIANKCSL